MIKLINNGVTISVTPLELDWYLNAGYERVVGKSPTTLVGKSPTIVESVDDAGQEKDKSDLSEMTIAALRNEAKVRGLSGYSNLAKDDLIAFLEKEGK